MLVLGYFYEDLLLVMNDSGIGNSIDDLGDSCNTLRSDAKVPLFSVATLVDYSGAGDSKQQ